MDAYNTVAEMLAEHLNQDAASFTMEAKLDELGMDDLESLEIIMELEETSGIELNPKELPHTVGDLVNLLSL